MKRLISIITPVYNVEDYIHVCLNSVLKQTYQDFEIICVDDASTDSTVEILEYFVQKDSRIKILKNESNKGPGFSRNKALKEAKGKYILFLDGDDWLSLNALEILVEKIEKVHRIRKIFLRRSFQNFRSLDFGGSRARANRRI